MIDQGVDFSDPAASRPAPVTRGRLRHRPPGPHDPRRRRRRLRGDRFQAITDHVSAVASVPEVRHRLLALQRAIIGEGGIVVEGRDIGSVVAPDAAVKAYLTADPSARAAGVRRRTARAAWRPPGPTCATRPDRLRRATAPAVMPDGAVHLDTTPYSLEEVIDQVVALVREATGVGSRS